MARPRIFVSSTYYDLKYIRDGILAFISSLGYEAILFEKGDIPFHPDMALEDSCYQEVESADMLILIIGGRFGSLSREDEEKVQIDPSKYLGRMRSITNREYDTARRKGVPTFVFIDQNVFSEHRTYVENKENNTIKYAHVDNPAIYETVDDILSQRNTNFLKSFSNLDDITSWLRDQWAGIFAEFLKKKGAAEQIKNIENQISDLTSVVSTLKSYSEAIIKQVNKSESADIISAENKNLLAARAKKLMRHGLMRYIRTAYNPALTGEDALGTLLNSSDVLDFLEKVGLDRNQIENFEGHSNGAAEREYSRLKKLYSAADFDLDDVE